MWTPASHGGITRLNFNTGPDAQIWTPDIVVFSASVYPFILALHACGPQDAKKYKICVSYETANKTYLFVFYQLYVKFYKVLRKLLNRLNVYNTR